MKLIIALVMLTTMSLTYAQTIVFNCPNNTTSEVVVEQIKLAASEQNADEFFMVGKFQNVNKFIDLRPYFYDSGYCTTETDTQLELNCKGSNNPRAIFDKIQVWHSGLDRNTFEVNFIVGKTILRGRDVISQGEVCAIRAVN